MVQPHVCVVHLCMHVCLGVRMRRQAVAAAPWMGRCPPPYLHAQSPPPLPPGHACRSSRRPHPILVLFAPPPPPPHLPHLPTSRDHKEAKLQELQQQLAVLDQDLAAIKGGGQGTLQQQQQQQPGYAPFPLHRQLAPAPDGGTAAAAAAAAALRPGMSISFHTVTASGDQVSSISLNPWQLHPGQRVAAFNAAVNHAMSAANGGGQAGPLPLPHAGHAPHASTLGEQRRGAAALAAAPRQQGILQGGPQGTTSVALGPSGAHAGAAATTTQQVAAMQRDSSPEGLRVLPAGAAQQTQQQAQQAQQLVQSTQPGAGAGGSSSSSAAQQQQLPKAAQGAAPLPHRAGAGSSSSSSPAAAGMMRGGGGSSGNLALMQQQQQATHGTAGALQGQAGMAAAHGGLPAVQYAGPAATGPFGAGGGVVQHPLGPGPGLAPALPQAAAHLSAAAGGPLLAQGGPRSLLGVAQQQQQAAGHSSSPFMSTAAPLSNGAPGSTVMPDNSQSLEGGARTTADGDPSASADGTDKDGGGPATSGGQHDALRLQPQQQQPAARPVAPPQPHLQPAARAAALATTAVTAAASQQPPRSTLGALPPRPLLPAGAPPAPAAAAAGGSGGVRPAVAGQAHAHAKGRWQDRMEDDADDEEEGYGDGDVHGDARGFAGAGAGPGPSSDGASDEVRAAKRRKMLSQYDMLEQCYLRMRARWGRALRGGGEWGSGGSDARVHPAGRR